MAQVLVRNIEEQTKHRLKMRASMHGVSMEEEVRRILQRAANEPLEPPSGQGLGDRIVALFKDCPLEEPIKELKLNLKPAEFRD